MTTLNARVSILAAANPVGGRYNTKRSIEDNIQLPAALLSRFDLLWLIADKSDRESDLRLARHIAFVHQNNTNPPQQTRPLSMNVLRAFIARCQKQVPFVPPELSEFIVNCYCEMRKESRAEENKNTSTFTSPRTLLASLRLSTALARLRESRIVEKDDVREAIRLMEMSKDSLKLPADRGQQEVDRIYQFILSIAEGSKTIKVQDIRLR